jgi:hypothetical protein
MRGPLTTRTAAMIQLHYYPGNANLIPHILLRELDLPFELVKVDRDTTARTAVPPTWR